MAYLARIDRIFGNGTYVVHRTDDRWLTREIPFPVKDLLGVVLLNSSANHRPLRLVFENEAAIQEFLSENTPEFEGLRKFIPMARRHGDYLVTTDAEIRARALRDGTRTIRSQNSWHEDLQGLKVSTEGRAATEFSAMKHAAHTWTWCPAAAMNDASYAFHMERRLEYWTQLEAAAVRKPHTLVGATVRISGNKELPISVNTSVTGMAILVPDDPQWPTLRIMLREGKSHLAHLGNNPGGEYPGTLYREERPGMPACCQDAKERSLTSRVIPLDVLSATKNLQMSMVQP